VPGRECDAPWYRYWERAVGADAGESEAVAGRSAAEVMTMSRANSARRGVSSGADGPGSRPAPPVVDGCAAASGVARQAVFHVEHGIQERGSTPFVVVVANQKGGVGKTTTAIGVAAALTELSCRVLLVDLDPQGNATSGVGAVVPPGQPSAYDVVIGACNAEEAIAPTGVPALDLLPATIDLAGAEIELVSVFSRELRVRRALAGTKRRYDVVVIDCPPSLGLLTVNALSAADGVLVPIQCEYYALEGLDLLRRNVELIRADLNPDLEVIGFVLTMLDGRTRLSQQVVDEVAHHVGDRVFQTRIPRTVRLAEAPGFGQPITVFDPASRGALAYRRLATEVLQRIDEQRTAGVALASEVLR
jgi:chromosome partitioning protein